MNDAFSFSANPDSSAISGMAYTEEGGSLVLIMESGAVLLYLRVPKAKATGLLGAESVGSFYNKEIRNKYRYLRIGTHEKLAAPFPGVVNPADIRNETLNQVITDMFHQNVSNDDIREAVEVRNSQFIAPLEHAEVNNILKRIEKR